MQLPDGKVPRNRGDVRLNRGGLRQRFWAAASGSGVICASAFRIGVLETVICPSNGVSISTIRKMQAASATALSPKLAATVALRGAL
jgi:hypothetical protein